MITKYKLINIIFITYYIIFNYKNILKYEYINSKIKLNANSKFMIIQKRVNYSPRGLMSYYYHNLGYGIDYLTKGYIPIIDMASHPNMFNHFKITNDSNPWEEYFYQYIYCDIGNITTSFNIYYNEALWIIGIIWLTFICLLKKKIKRKKNEINYLFKRSHNVLGIIIRGTDYVNRKPVGHPR